MIARFVAFVEELAKARKPPKSAVNDPNQGNLFGAPKPPTIDPAVRAAPKPAPPPPEPEPAPPSKTSVYDQIEQDYGSHARRTAEATGAFHAAGIHDDGSSRVEHYAVSDGEIIYQGHDPGFDDHDDAIRSARSRNDALTARGTTTATPPVVAAHEPPAQPIPPLAEPPTSTATVEPDLPPAAPEPTPTTTATATAEPEPPAQPIPPAAPAATEHLGISEDLAAHFRHYESDTMGQDDLGTPKEAFVEALEQAQRRPPKTEGPELLIKLTPEIEAYLKHPNGPIYQHHDMLVDAMFDEKDRGEQQRLAHMLRELDDLKGRFPEGERTPLPRREPAPAPAPAAAKEPEQAPAPAPAPKQEAAPEAYATHAIVKPHVRQTEHGPVVVAGHIRHLDPKAAFKLKAHELEAHVASGGESAAVAQAEIDRRAAKRAANGKPPIKSATPGDKPKSERASKPPITEQVQQPAASATPPSSDMGVKRTAAAPLPWTADQGRAESTAKLSREQAVALASKAREKGQALVEKHADDAERIGLENTRKRVSEGNARRARAQKELNRGKRYLKLAEQIEQGYEPDEFDRNLVHHPDDHDLARRIWEQRRDLGDKDSIPYTQSVEWTWKTKPGAFFRHDDIDKHPKVRSAVWANSDAHPHGGGRLADASPRAIEMIDAAIKHEKPEGSTAKNLKDGLADMRRNERLGFHDPEDHKRIAERYARFRELTGKDAAPAAAKWRAPERMPSTTPIEQRMARAEQIESKRWKDPEHQKIPGYFPTPAPEVVHMIERADLQPGMSVLEPSAGTGDIADQLPSDVQITVAEHNHTLRDVLAQKGYGSVHGDALSVPGTFDRVVMNPPFEKGQDMLHVQHAFEHNLQPGGKLVAIVSRGALTGSTKAHEAFRAFVDEHRAEEDRNIDNDAWKRSGTAVSATMITLQKPNPLGKGVRLLARVGPLAAMLRMGDS